jgi:hypothetical protein
MTRIAGFVTLVIALSAVLVAQESATGRWQGKTPNGASILLELAAKGNDLTGTMTVGAQKSAIENGKVSKNTFNVRVTMRGGTEEFTGEINGDEIKMWMADRGPSSAITLKRVKPAQK